MDYMKLSKFVPETVRTDFRRGNEFVGLIKKVIDAETSSTVDRSDVKSWLNKALLSNNEIISEPDATNGYKRRLKTAFSDLKVAYKEYLAVILGELADEDIKNKDHFLLLQTLFGLPRGGRPCKKPQKAILE